MLASIGTGRRHDLIDVGSSTAALTYVGLSRVSVCREPRNLHQRQCGAFSDAVVGMRGLRHQDVAACESGVARALELLCLVWHPVHSVPCLSLSRSNAKLLGFLLDKNRRYNLTTVRHCQQESLRHVSDCLALLPDPLLHIPSGLPVHACRISSLAMCETAVSETMIDYLSLQPIITEMLFVPTGEAMVVLAV